MKISRVFLDTSFFIRLFKTDEPDHASARAYFAYFLEHSDVILLSTIVAAEYGTGASITDLPFAAPKVRLVTFNLAHAQKAVELARFAFAEKRKGSVAVGNRVVIPNDTKILAQAEVEQVDYFFARDKNCASVHHMLRTVGLLRFNYVDLRTSVAEFRGTLF